MSTDKIRGSVILVASGNYIDPLNLHPEDIRIEDVAHALARQCRFSGHVSKFYSVAEHSWRCAKYAASKGWSTEIQLWCLLHDATEFALIDLPRPLKDYGPLGDAYREVETRAQKTVAEAFGLPWEMPAEVHEADLVLLATERRDLMPNVGEWEILEGVETLPDKIKPLSTSWAETEFLTLYDVLTERRGKEQDAKYPGLVKVRTHAGTPSEALAEVVKEEAHTGSTEAPPERLALEAIAGADESWDVRAYAADVLDGTFVEGVSEYGLPEPHPETKPTNPKDAVGSDKLPLHLWPETATLMGTLGMLDGALKYGRANWRKSGVRASIYVDALRRHVNAYFEGEDTDPDSGMPHLSHALACLAILVDADAAGMLTDDRQVEGGYRGLVDELTPMVKALKERHASKNPHHFTIADNETEE